MRIPKRRPSKKVERPLSRSQDVASQHEQTQKDYEAFKGWIESGEASKPITADELQQMLRLVSKIK